MGSAGRLIRYRTGPIGTLTTKTLVISGEKGFTTPPSGQRFAKFEQLGAPWIDGVQLSHALNARRIPGVSFCPVRFTPTFSKYTNKECQGVFMIVTDRLALRPVRLGVEIAAMLHKLYGAKFELEAAKRLLGSKDALSRIRAGDAPEAIAASWSAGEARWRIA